MNDVVNGAFLSSAAKRKLELGKIISQIGTDTIDVYDTLWLLTIENEPESISDRICATIVLCPIENLRNLSERIYSVNSGADSYSGVRLSNRLRESDYPVQDLYYCYLGDDENKRLCIVNAETIKQYLEEDKQNSCEFVYYFNPHSSGEFSLYIDRKNMRRIETLIRERTQ